MPDVQDITIIGRSRVPIAGVYEWQNSTYEGEHSAIAIDPSVVEKKPERKGRKERDQGIARDDAGPEKPPALIAEDEGPNVDPTVRAKRLAKTFKWATHCLWQS